MALAERASFGGARRHGRMLLAAGAICAVAGLLLFAVGCWGVARAPGARPLSVPVPRSAAHWGLALWLAAGGLLPAGVMALGRAMLADAESGIVRVRSSRSIPSDATPNAGGSVWDRLVAQALGRVRRLALPPLDGEAVTGWVQAAATALFGVAGLLAAVILWRLSPDRGLTLLAQRIWGVALVAGAFPLLVLQRSFAVQSPERLPEAPQIERLLRAPLAVGLWTGILLVLSSAGQGWTAPAERFCLLLLMAVALELALRSSALLFAPFAPVEVRRAVADSQVAGVLLRLQWPSLKAANIAVRRQLGIDLSRSWALAFVRRAALPVVLGMGVLAWAMSGVTALGVDQRGVYERFGAPVAVFGSGVHLHAPWPLGRVRPVENGVVHQLPIEFLLPSGDKGGAPPKEAEPAIVGAEAHPSEDSDRLWTGDHPFEGSYLIASEQDGRQSFQLVDTDMAVIYRVGRSDKAALDAAYRLENPDELIQALSGQLLVRYFVQHRLLNILGQSRESFAADFQAQLQAQLDALSSGLEVLAVSIEAIHPPPGAAAAYHDVQAAEIRARSAVFSSQARAVTTMTAARQAALRTNGEAMAGGAEMVSQAQADAALFGGDRKAYALGRPAFMLERRLGAVTRALVKPRSVVVVDHRLSGAQVPTLDLRGLSPPELESNDPDD